MAATPLYFLNAIRKGSFQLRGLARYNWVVPVLGGALGAAAGWVESIQITAPVLTYRVAGIRMDSERMRRDDFQLIGSVVGALALPALFLRRVGLINGLLGGAGLGSATGVLSFYGKAYMNNETPELPIPNVEMPQAK